MALYSCSITTIGRATGRSAVASAAYRAGEKLEDERQGLVWDFTQRRGVLHAEIVLPPGAPEWARDRERLWNAAEMRETRHAKQDTARTARDFRLALPHEASDEQRLGIAREFAQFLVERYGGAVDFAIHMPDRRGDNRNFHAHVMMTTRRMDAEGLTTKIRELDDKRKGPIEFEHIRETWEGIQNRLHDQLGIPRVSCKTLEAQGIDREATIHLGVSATAMERKGEVTELGDLNREIFARNAARERIKEEREQASAKIIDLDAEREKRAGEKAIRAEAKTLDPDRILESITERRATFSRAELNRHLTEVLPDARARSAFMDETLSREAVVPLRENETAPVSRYTTRAVLDGERRITAAAERMDKGDRHGVSGRGIAKSLDRHSFLDREQRDALAWATRSNGFSIIAGEAGTGKSATLAAIRDAYEADGFRVVGLAWTNAVVQDMKRDGFSRSATIASELMRQTNGRDPWNRRTVLMVDEAAMVSTKHLATLLAKADSAGAKVILAGDEKQLASIERGGMFGVLRTAHGAAELHTVRRVRDDDQKGAFNAMHRGDFRAALDTFDKRGAIRWQKTPEESLAALVKQWSADNAADPGKSRFVFAYTNAEVNELNGHLRSVRRARGELGADHVLKTREGEQTFATGDRVQFTGNSANRAQRDAGLFNGAAGVVTRIEGDRMRVALDAPKGEKPREVSFTVGANAAAGEFDAIRHGYAGTIYKGQGKTLDQTYLLHSDHWRSAASYVALSRHRDSVTLFAAEKPSPWIMAEGGVAGLSPKQRESAEKSFGAWAEAKPELAKKHGFENYVSYVQAQAKEEQRLNPLDRLAQQMSRVEERRAASAFVQGARGRGPSAEQPTPSADPPRKPHLSIVAGIVGDYLKLCYDPAKDWLRWVAEDLRNRASLRRDAATIKQGRDDVHTEGAGAVVEDANRIRRDPLPELQGGLDAQRPGRDGVDRVPPGPRTDPPGNDGLRPVRDAGRVAAAQATTPAPSGETGKPLRGKALFAADLKAAKESVAASGPTRDQSRAVGRTRSPGRDR